MDLLTEVVGNHQSKAPCPVGALPPSRGLILLANRHGASLRPVDIERWLRLTRTVYRCDKADILAPGMHVQNVERYLNTAAELDLRLSLRTDATPPPPDLAAFRAAGLLDVFLCPTATSHLNEWLQACKAAGLPVRMQWTAPLDAGIDANAADMVTASVAAYDPFVSSGPVHDSKAELANLNALVSALRQRGIDADFLNVPFCLADEANRAAVVNSAQFFRAHTHYQAEAYALAAQLYERGPIAAAKAVQILLGKHALWENPIDSKLLPWIIERPWIRARAWALHKITRHFRTRTLPDVVDASPEARREALERRERQRQAAEGPVCGACSLRRICDQAPAPFRSALPGLSITAQPGDLVADPLHFAHGRRVYCDELDAQRLRRRETSEELAASARALMANRTADREISPFDYLVLNSPSDPVHGGVRWFSMTNTEKLSSPLADLKPPFTLAAVFGGGIAEYVGFALGRRARLMCPMTAFSHTVTLHVEEDGRYVLLRDGQPVVPVEFQGAYYVPPRLGSHVEPCFALWNIDGEIVTQNVRLWTPPEASKAGSNVRFSFLLVCTRYSRRLQASLLSIVNQQGIDLDSAEVVLAYVPGYDTSEDILRSFEVAYPQLRIVRSPFSESNAREKGFMINESAKLASGEWTVLLDADIVIPPDLLAKIDAVPEEVAFVAPDGRKMLTEEETAQILLGQAEPWREWDKWLEGPGEYRQREAKGVPIGYCQIVRTRCLDTVKYDEYGHFEGADYRFGVDMREHFGTETRLEGTVVLHLFHGGSQWYGTQRHY
ncbi:MAG: glycosyltransferase family A protein [FCB group bacterium]|jgi:hypothetical protein|nr:glycosyltransferase family A protein [FCB group bacterium]